MAEGAPLLREYGGKTLSRVRIPPSPPNSSNSTVLKNSHETATKFRSERPELRQKFTGGHHKELKKIPFSPLLSYFLFASPVL